MNLGRSSRAQCTLLRDSRGRGSTVLLTSVADDEASRNEFLWVARRSRPTRGLHQLTQFPPSRTERFKSISVALNVDVSVSTINAL